jgi:hypothetical protein
LFGNAKLSTAEILSQHEKTEMKSVKAEDYVDVDVKPSINLNEDTQEMLSPVTEEDRKKILETPLQGDYGEFIPILPVKVEDPNLSYEEEVDKVGEREMSSDSDEIDPKLYHLEGGEDENLSFGNQE